MQKNKISTSSITNSTAANIRVGIKKAAKKVKEIKRSKNEKHIGSIVWSF